MYAARRKVLRMLYDGTLAVAQAEDLLDALKAPAAPAPPAPQFVGDSPWACEFRRTLLQLARARAPFWLQGQPGTGKVVAAQFVHGHSERRDGPFVLHPCSADDSALLGSATGPGALEQAHSGTLVLENPEALSPAAQRQLITLLQSGVFHRGDAPDPIAADVRLCALTDQDLGALAQARQFDAQLAQLLGLHLTIPPLHQRPEDILSLARHGLERLAERDGRPTPTLSSEAEQLLLAADWTPDNARPLGQLVERALILCEGDEITPEHLPDLAP